MYRVVLLRHGESDWNKENRFTGWTDVDLSAVGREEARRAGAELKREGYFFDVAFTSVLKRAIHTLHIALDELDQAWLPEHKSWRLNERHYGALQGLDKAETAAKFGAEQVKLWRRSFDVPPPALTPEDDRYPGRDPRYKGLAPHELPLTESLKETIVRVVPHWNDVIVPAITSGQRVIVAAHGNSLRALIKHLDKVSDAEIVALNVPTGIPLVYELDAHLEPIRHHYLGDPEEIRRKIEAVAGQANVKK